MDIINRLIIKIESRPWKGNYYIFDLIEYLRDNKANLIQLGKFIQDNPNDRELKAFLTGILGNIPIDRYMTLVAIFILMSSKLFIKILNESINSRLEHGQLECYLKGLSFLSNFKNSDFTRMRCILVQKLDWCIEDIINNERKNILLNLSNIIIKKHSYKINDDSELYSTIDDISKILYDDKYCDFILGELRLNDKFYLRKLVKYLINVYQSYYLIKLT